MKNEALTLKVYENATTITLGSKCSQTRGEKLKETRESQFMKELKKIPHTLSLFTFTKAIEDIISKAGN